MALILLFTISGLREGPFGDSLLCPKVSAQATRANEKAVIEENIRASIGWALTKDRPFHLRLEISA